MQILCYVFKQAAVFTTFFSTYNMVTLLLQLTDLT